jgi:ATP-dependent DNA ligase
MSIRFRIISRKDGERVRLYSRPGNDFTRRFPLIVETLTMHITLSSDMVPPVIAPFVHLSSHSVRRKATFCDADHITRAAIRVPYPSNS